MNHNVIKAENYGQVATYNDWTDRQGEEQDRVWSSAVSNLEGTWNKVVRVMLRAERLRPAVGVFFIGINTYLAAQSLRSRRYAGISHPVNKKNLDDLIHSFMFNQSIHEMITISKFLFFIY